MVFDVRRWPALSGRARDEVEFVDRAGRRSCSSAKLRETGAGSCGPGHRRRQRGDRHHRRASAGLKSWFGAHERRRPTTPADPNAFAGHGPPGSGRNRPLARRSREQEGESDRGERASRGAGHRRYGAVGLHLPGFREPGFQGRTQVFTGTVLPVAGASLRPLRHHRHMAPCQARRGAATAVAWSPALLVLVGLPAMQVIVDGHCRLGRKVSGMLHGGLSRCRSYSARTVRAPTVDRGGTMKQPALKMLCQHRTGSCGRITCRSGRSGSRQSSNRRASLPSRKVASSSTRSASPCRAKFRNDPRQPPNWV